MTVVSTFLCFFSRYISRKAVRNISAILGFRASKEAIRNTLGMFNDIHEYVCKIQKSVIRQVYFLHYLHIDNHSEFWLKKILVKRISHTFTSFSGSFTLFFFYSDSFIKDPAGKVTFVTFLEFIIKNQEGSDPFEEAQQVI